MLNFVNPSTGECFSYEEDVDQDWLAVEISSRGLVSCPPRPSVNHTWDVISGCWLEDTAARDEALTNEARAGRDLLITACDWTVLPDAPLTASKKTEWKAYRQALRDLTSQAGFPQMIDWPVMPVK